jgi:5-methylcytosine-specific restriction endonuclease McrA
MSIIPDQPVGEDAPADMKQCRKCGASFPATTEYFSRDKKGKLGLHYWCKPCCQQSGRQYKRENPEAIKDYQQQYRDEHKKDMQVYKKQYRKEKQTEIAGYLRQYKRENREMHNQYDHRRRTKLGSGGFYSKADVAALYELQGGQCCWCGCPVINRMVNRTAPSKDKYVIDHLIPVSRGGSNWWWNIVLACPHCNGSHHARYVFWEWQPQNLLLTMEHYLLAAMVTETMWQYARWRVIRGIV